MIISRRSFLASALAAPIIVRPGILMPVRPAPQWVWVYAQWGTGVLLPWMTHSCVVAPGETLHHGDLVSFDRHGRARQWHPGETICGAMISRAS